MLKKKRTKAPKQLPPIRLKLVDFGPVRKEIRGLKKSRKKYQETRHEEAMKYSSGMQNLSKEELKKAKEKIIERRRGAVRLERLQKEAELRKRELRKEQYEEVKKFAGKVSERIEKKISKWGRKKAVSKPILKKQKIIVRIKEHKPEPYVSRYFKESFEEDKRQFFFK